MNRDLDMKVAKALGWRWFTVLRVWVLMPPGYEAQFNEVPQDGEPPADAKVEHREGYCYFYDSRRSPSWRYRPVPAYSTDPAALTEMLAHLAVIAPDLELRAAWWSSASPTAWIAKLGDAQVEGATLSEAVARLVVACAEAKP